MTCNSDFPSYHTLMGSLLEVTTVLSHFILTLLTGPRLNVDFWAQIHYILIAMNQGLSQSGLNLNSATHPGPPWAPRPSANQKPVLWGSDQSEARSQDPRCRNHQGEIFVRMVASLTQIPRLYWVLIMSKLNICQMLQPVQMHCSVGVTSLTMPMLWSLTPMFMFLSLMTSHVMCSAHY